MYYDVILLKEQQMILMEIVRDKMAEILYESDSRNEKSMIEFARKTEQLALILQEIACAEVFDTKEEIKANQACNPPKPVESLDPMPEPEPDPVPEPTPEPEKAEDPEDDLPSKPRTCKDCEHCIGRSGKGRGMQYKCGLSDAWFGRNLGRDAFRRKK